MDAFFILYWSLQLLANKKHTGQGNGKKVEKKIHAHNFQTKKNRIHRKPLI